MKRCGREPVLFRVGVHIFDHNGDTPEASKRLSLTLVISSDWLRNDEKHAHEHRGGSQVRDLEKHLAEALEREKATSEILRVIGSSSTDIQPVFDIVAESAARLCQASDTSIFRLDGDRLRRVAHHGSIPAGVIGEFTV